MTNQQEMKSKAMELAIAAGFRGHEELATEADFFLNYINILPKPMVISGKGIYIPIINKILAFDKSGSTFNHKEALEYCEKRHFFLPTRREVFILMYYKTEINELLKQKGTYIQDEKCWCYDYVGDGCYSIFDLSNEVVLKLSGVSKTYVRGLYTT